MSSSGMGRDVYRLDIVSPEFSLPNAALPTLLGALKGNFRRAVVAL